MGFQYQNNCSRAEGVSHPVDNILERFTGDRETEFTNNFSKCDTVIDNDAASDNIAADYFGDIITSVTKHRDH